jgi:hypothetical protein
MVNPQVHCTNVANYKGYEYWLVCQTKNKRPFYGWAIVRPSGVSILIGGARSLTEAIECVEKTIDILEAIKL